VSSVLGKLIQAIQPINILGSIPPYVAPAGGPLVFDNFNRSNRSLDGDTCSDGVNTWTKLSAGDWRIASNQVQAPGSWAKTMVLSFDARESMTVKVTVKLRAYSNYVFVYGRYYDNSNWYALHFYQNKVRIRQTVGGSASDISTAYAVVVNDVVEMVIDDLNIILKINDVEKANVTGGDFGQPGHAGLYGYANWEFDDFEVSA
jgi:hypothetical protein